MIIYQYSHELSLAASILCTGIAQTFLKKGSSNKFSYTRNMLNINTIVGYTLFFMVTVLNVYALQKLPYKLLVAWVPLSYAIVSFFSFVFLKEKFNKNKIFGTVLILAGIAVFSI